MNCGIRSGASFVGAIAFLVAGQAFAQQDDFVILFQFTNTSTSDEELASMMYPALPVHLSYEPRFNLAHGDTTQALPEPRIFDIVAERVLREMQHADHDYVILDIETWRTDRGVSEAVFEESVDKYIQAVEEMKGRLPTFRLGNYGKPVQRDYAATRDEPEGNDYRAWMDRNDGLQRLADVLDVFYPSLYTFDKDEHEAWLRYASAHVEESRRLATKGQPVIAFVWPMYHDRSDFAGEFIGYDFWLLQLQTLREIADGIVIWSNQSGPVDRDSEWFRATAVFLRQQIDGAELVNIAEPERIAE